MDIGEVEFFIADITQDTTAGIIVAGITVEGIMVTTIITGIADNLKKIQEDATVERLIAKLNRCGPAVIFGGAVRDWIIGKTPRDIDIVLDCPNNSLEFLSNFKAQKNRFGGYYIKIGNLELDIWNLDSTWAFSKDPQFKKNLKTLTQTVFFNMDAVLFYLDTNHLQDDGFTQAMESRVLDIVYEPNPFPYLCVSKALCALTKYDMRPSENLKRFIAEQMDKGYTKKSFTKYAELKNIPMEYDECIKRVSC